MIAAHYCYCDVESWRERESRYKQKTVGCWAYYFERKRNANVFFPRRETYADVLGKRFLKVPGELEQDMPSSTR